MTSKQILRKISNLRVVSIKTNRRIEFCVSRSEIHQHFSNVFQQWHTMAQACKKKHARHRQGDSTVFSEYLLDIFGGDYLIMQSCVWIHTLDLQLAGDGGLPLGVLGSASVNATVEAAGFPDLQWTDALVGDLPKLWIISNDHLILQPLDLRLRDRHKTFFYRLYSQP